MIERLATFLRGRGVDLDTLSVAFDIGSRDGLQALELAQLLPEAEVVAIECNLQTLKQCRRNVAQSSRIKLVEKAINSFTGRCPFYPIDPDRTVTTWADGNPGASSLFIANGEYPIERYAQSEIEVECVRLDDLSRQLGIDAIDLIWMDLQGGELLALQSAGNLLDKVRYIYTEVSHRPLYHGQCLFEDVDAFLTARGFRRCTAVDRSRWQQDLIYENRRDLIDVVIPVASNDGDGAEFAARSARNFIADARHIYVVGAEDPKLHGTRFINQSEFPFDIQAVSRLLSPSEQPELYWRQLVRLHFPLVHRASLRHVLAMEPQTVFLRPCQFLSEGVGVFTFGDEYRSADFEHMARLYPVLHRMFAYSGAVGCMLFSRTWLKELHEAVEAHHGMPFWRAYLQALDPGKEDRGASDYEIYLNFSLTFHAWELIIRGLRRSRIASPDEIQPDRLDLVCMERDLARSPIARERLERLLSGNSAEGVVQGVPGFLAISPVTELARRP